MDIQALRELFDYDPASGVIRRKVKRAIWTREGEEAGYLKPDDGYRLIAIRQDGKRHSFYAHRLAWALHYGRWPAQQIDHINGDKDDNRLSNLREATHMQNQWNKAKAKRSGVHSPLKGASYHRSSGLWRARIRLDGKERSLGYFTTEQQAHEAYARAAVVAHGEFARIT
jgi:hypothetical protein